jgi:hypothetical protein
MDNAPTERYGTRYIVNATLFLVEGLVATPLFMGHILPYGSVKVLGGVSLAVLLATAWILLGKISDPGRVLQFLRPWLYKEITTRVLLGLFPLIVIAYLITFTLTLTAAKDSDVSLRLRWRGSSQEVSLSPGETRTVTYFGLSRVVPNIETLAPTGFRPFDHPLTRGIPTALGVPTPGSKKTFYLVRLIPLYDFFQLRGRRDPDKRYTLHVFLPGAQKPIEHKGLTFSALYLGASLPDLQSKVKEGRKAVNELRNKLLAFDSDLKESDIDGILADWLDNPQFIPTPELKPGDRVRVVVDSPDGKSETTVNVASTLNNGFLRGSAE